MDEQPNSRLSELALLFLKLGTTAFGGPAAHIAMMETEVVRKRRWLTEKQFMDFLGAVNLIPGPNSTEMAIHIGAERAGVPGLIVAGICFIFPAMAIVMVIAWLYIRFGELPRVQGLLYGVKPVIIAVVAQAIWNLTRRAMRRTGEVVLAAFSAAASLGGVAELLILFISGFFSLLIDSEYWPQGGGGPSMRPRLWIVGVSILTIGGSAFGAIQPATFSMGKMFWFFLKVGSILYGSGYVLLAFLKGDLVESYGWLTKAQLLDATAVGQFTPGPVFTTATFIGFLLAGFGGAVVATVGIFLPSFVFVGLSSRIIPRLRRSRTARAFLDGVNAASLGLMAAVTIQLGREAITDVFTAILLVISAAVLIFRPSINSAWLVMGGAGLGIFRTLLH